MTETREKLEQAAGEANDLVIALSLAIMDTDSSDATRAQARMFQPVFGAIRGVLSEAARGYWPPATAPDDWETFESSRAALNLADAVLAIRGGAL